MASGLVALHMPSVQDYLIQEEVLTRDQLDNFPLPQHVPLSGCHVPQSLCRKVGQEVHTAFVSEVWLSSLSVCLGLGHDVAHLGASCRSSWGIMSLILRGGQYCCSGSRRLDRVSSYEPKAVILTETNRGSSSISLRKHHAIFFR